MPLNERFFLVVPSKELYLSVMASRSRFQPIVKKFQRCQLPTEKWAAWVAACLATECVLGEPSDCFKLLSDTTSAPKCQVCLQQGPLKWGQVSDLDLLSKSLKGNMFVLGSLTHSIYVRSEMLFKAEFKASWYLQFSLNLEMEKVTF